MALNSVLNNICKMLKDGCDNDEIINFIEEVKEHQNDHDHHDYDHDNGYSYSEQRHSDVLDYTRQQYESGRISYEQMQEMRVGA